MNEAGFRNVGAVRRILDKLAAMESPRTLRFMHVCGTHENALCEYGLRDQLPPWIKLVAGPGCPVCVCPASEIDMARRLAVNNGVLLATFGDVMRVPAKGGSLLEAKTAGADCRVVYGIDAAIQLAVDNPQREVVFFAVGFETTACTTAAALKRGVPANFSVLTSHRLVPPALLALLDLDGVGADGFILPGHASAIIGLEGYNVLEQRAPAMAVAGFEPTELLLAIHHLASRVLGAEDASSEFIFNAYPRAVRQAGNTTARAIIDEVFEPADAAWRGIGVIPQSGLMLRPHLAAHDARVRYGITPDPTVPDVHKACRCGEVLLGQIDPEMCPLFGKACNPDRPLGPCMVAFEGTCHARFRHHPPQGAHA